MLDVDEDAADVATEILQCKNLYVFQTEDFRNDALLSGEWRS